MFQNAENEEEEKAESLRTSASIKSCDIEFHLKRVELRKKKIQSFLPNTICSTLLNSHIANDNAIFQFSTQG